MKDPEKLMEDIPNGVKDKLRFLPVTERFSDGGKECICVIVRPQKHPVYYDGQYYSRTGSVTTLLEGHELTLALMKREGISWTDRIADNISIGDLSKEAADYFVNLARDRGRIPVYAGSDDMRALLKHLDLLDGDDIKIAGALLFHPQPDHIVPGTTIDIGVFSEDGALLRDDTTAGPLIMQPDKAVEVLYERYIQGTYYIDGMDRRMRYDYPKEAVRECVMNAVIHKEYSRFLPVTIRVYPDRLEIFNHGKLPDGWTIEKLIGEHGSEPRNFRMAKVFYDAGRIEKWGIGIGMIMRSCRNAGMPDPKFEIFSDGLRVTFRPAAKLKIHSATANTEGLTPSEKKVYAVIAEGKFTTAEEAASSLGLSVVTVKRTTVKLKEKGLIRRTGSKKTGDWESICEINQ
ncbi:MAG: hypothetical protein FWD37_01700 [Methanomassiliicoccaceae archaeon]|nr:hypothetical protein [Methanomassiliicoccaceae archaeon]